MNAVTKERNKDLLKKAPLFFSGQNLYTLERQRLKAILFLFALVFFIGNIFNIVSGYPVELIVVQFVVLTFLITLFFLSGSKKRLKKVKTVFYLCMILISPFFYFYKGGLFGSYIYLYIPVVLNILLSNERVQKGLFIFACLTLLLVVLVEYYHPEIVVPARNEELKFFDVLINIFFDVFLIALIIYFSKKKYLLKKMRSKHIIEQYRKNKDSRKNKRKNINLLSLREREVYRLIVKGNSNKEIADTLYVSMGTVKNHITSIYKKLKVNNRTEFFNKIDS